MKTATETLIEILRDVTELRTAPMGVLGEKIRSRLEEELTDGEDLKTEYGALCLEDWTGSKFSEELRYENQAKILVSSPRSGLFDLAHLVKAENGDWKLRSFLFQCPACFGSGIVLDMDLCASCGAKGWGSVNF